MGTLSIDNGIEALDAFVGGWRFPSVTLAVLVGWPTLLLSVLAIPTDAGPMAEFAQQFKVWCFGYDPDTGALEVTYVVLLVVNPLVLVGVVVAVWWRSLKEGWRHHRPSMLRSMGAGFVVVLLAGAGLPALAEEAPLPVDGDLPFPAETLRTRHIPPSFDLIDQDGNRVTSDMMRGRVTLLTSVYASCPHTCPVILSQTKAALALLRPEVAEQVQVYAITMDPANDGPEAMGRLGDIHNMTTPQYRMLSGEVEPVERVLDLLGVARERDPETGVISHVNLFALVDRSGRIAYRLALGEQQEAWLPDALRLLVEEPDPAEPQG